MRLSAVALGRFSSRLDRRLRAQIFTAFRQSSDGHLEGGVGFERVAVVAVGIARRNQQGAIADHLGQFVPHPVRVARIFETGRQPLGDLEPLLDGCQQQDAGVRGQSPAVESDMHRLAGNGWQTRQNPRTFLHGGRELRCFDVIRPEQPNHTRNQRVMPLPPSLLASPMNFSG